jgi:hypothetical protein
MRRWLSISLILFFGLGPLAASLSTSTDSRLPACCRRSGTHHCAGSMDAASRMAQAPSNQPAVSAPRTCPYFPGNFVAPATTHALTASAVSLPGLLALSLSPSAIRAAARLSQIRTRAGRGPPSFSIA